MILQNRVHPPENQTGRKYGSCPSSHLAFCVSLSVKCILKQYWVELSQFLRLLPGSCLLP